MIEKFDVTSVKLHPEGNSGESNLLRFLYKGYKVEARREIRGWDIVLDISADGSCLGYNLKFTLKDRQAWDAIADHLFGLALIERDQRVKLAVQDMGL